MLSANGTRSTEITVYSVSVCVPVSTSVYTIGLCFTQVSVSVRSVLCSHMADSGVQYVMFSVGHTSSCSSRLSPTTAPWMVQ